MKYLRITIEGITPLLMNRFSEEEAEKLASGIRRASGAQERPDPHDIAERALYKLDDGTIIIPQPNLMSCIMEAGKFFKAGRSKITTAKTSLIPAAVFWRHEYFPLQSKHGSAPSESRRRGEE